tara:strand:+ start:40 stop:414 length:375 start_codon:yes stop_codon:yes gene_type:complete
VAELLVQLGLLVLVDGRLVVLVTGKFVEVDGSPQPGAPEVVVLTLVELVATVAALVHRGEVGLPPVPAKVLNARLQEIGGWHCPVCQPAVASCCLQLEAAELGVQIALFVGGSFLPSGPPQKFR